MFYAIIVQTSGQQTAEVDWGDHETRPSLDELIFDNIKDANKTLKKYKGSRMKTFESRDRALEFLENPGIDESFMESFIEEQPSKNDIDLSESLERLSLGGGSSRASEQKDKVSGETTTITTTITTASPCKTNESTANVSESPKYPPAQPALLNQLRRTIEAGDYEKVEEIIWSNPRCLVTVCDTATYLMAGPKFNACHIAARANKADIMALILDTISNLSFFRKLYPDEDDKNLQDRINHLLDSYLNTPDPRQGNTPLHFACKKGFYQVVRVLLTFEGCDLKIRDSSGHTAEESIGEQEVVASDGDAGSNSIKTTRKIKDLFRTQLDSPLHRDQLKKRISLAKRRSSGDGLIL